jgi:ankyrin repeat protein
VKPWEALATAVLMLAGAVGSSVAARSRPEAECALAEASLAGDVRRVAALLAEGADADCKGGGKAPLSEAIDAEKPSDALAVARALVEGGASVDARDGRGASACRKALARWMAGKGDAYKEIAKLLLSRGARLEDHAPAFEFAMKSVTDDIVPLLKPKQALVRHWIFRLAYVRGDLAMRTPRSLRVIGMLLDKGAPVNGVDPKSGDALLHIAVQFRDLELVRLLKVRGGDPMAKHRRKKTTPIGMAEAGLKGRYAKAYRGMLEILREP